MFRPHGNVHPMTLPILVYRAMWNIWGIHSYRPYQVLIVMLHLVCALLLRAVMRHLGVRPWTATLVASLFVLFGAGAQNILWPIAITWLGSLLFGLTQLFLADHDGPFDRRDSLGLVAGFAALLCSAVGIAVVVAVGVAAFMRRGWRIALIHTVPLGLLYALWWVTLARPSYDAARAAHPTSSSQMVRFIIETIINTFRALGQLSITSVLLVVLLFVGLFLAWRPMSSDELRARAGIPVGLIVGAIVFLGLTGFGRGATGAGASERGRYLYVVAALVLPALAVAIDAVIRRWVALVPVVLALMVIGIPGNLNAAADYARAQRGLRFRTTQLTLPRLPMAREVPRSHIPQTGPHYYYVTIGWLLDGVASGRIPAPRVITRAEGATDNLRLSLSRYAKPIPQFAVDTCVALHGNQRPSDIELRLNAGQQMRVNHALIRLLPASGPTDPVFPFELDGRQDFATTVAIRDGTVLRVQPESVVAPDAQICASASAFNSVAAPAMPSSQRNPDTPTFCATAVNIQEFLTRMTSETGRRARSEAARRIHDVLLPLLANAQHSAPIELESAVDTFTQAVRIGLFTGKNQLGKPAVDNAGSEINTFMMNTCGFPQADIKSGLE
jgi:hypothetical protein